jgi:hypothetical protein
MNLNDQMLQRLVRSAARAPRPLPEGAPLAVESKVLACWRRLPFEAVDRAQLVLPLLRRAAVCACVLMLVSIALSYGAIINADDEVVMIANSVVDLTLLP